MAKKKNTKSVNSTNDSTTSPDTTNASHDSHHCINCNTLKTEKDMFYNRSATMILPDIGWLCNDSDECVKVTE